MPEEVADAVVPEVPLERVGLLGDPRRDRTDRGGVSVAGTTDTPPGSPTDSPMVPVRGGADLDGPQWTPAVRGGAMRRTSTGRSGRRRCRAVRGEASVAHSRDRPVQFRAA